MGLVPRSPISDARLIPHGSLYRDELGIRRGALLSLKALARLGWIHYAARSRQARHASEKVFGRYFSNISCRTISGWNRRAGSAFEASSHHCFKRSHFGISSKSSRPLV